MGTILDFLDPALLFVVVAIAVEFDFRIGLLYSYEVWDLVYELWR